MTLCEAPLWNSEKVKGEKNMKCSVVILSWNAEGLLRQFLPNVMQCTHLKDGEDYEVVVADNGSDDGSVAYVESLMANDVTAMPLRIVRFNENKGYAEGYNMALREIDAEYSVLLNNDVEVTDGWLEKMVEYMDAHPECAACQPKLMSLKERSHYEYAGACGGFLDRYGYPFCRGRIFSTIEEDHGQYDDDVPLLWATGACLMVRTREFFEVGGLDGRFFAHMEEVDLCWRLRCRCREVRCVSGSLVYHKGASTLASSNPRKTFLNFRNSLLTLYKNLPDSELRHVMARRRVLDTVAAISFLLKGEGENFHVVFDAWREMRAMLKDFESDRLANIAAATAAGNPQMEVPERKNIHLVARYYLGRRKLFSEL